MLPLADGTGRFHLDLSEAGREGRGRLGAEMFEFGIEGGVGFGFGRERFARSKKQPEQQLELSRHLCKYLSNAGEGRWGAGRETRGRWGKASISNLCFVGRTSKPHPQ